jgi:outer membrane protein OmpA-like peptidoglycan-associated protein
VFPFIASNGSLYFSSDGHDGIGGLDIYETVMKNGVPAKVFNMGMPVNSNKDDFGIWLSEDNKSGFISSNRKAGGMDDDIYELQILREVKRGKDIKIITRDKETQEPLTNVKVVINGDTLVSNDKGEVARMIEEGIQYKIEVLKADYFSAEDTMSAGTSPEDSFTKEILIEKDPKLFLRALITDANTHALLEGVTLKITDISTNTDLDLYTTTAEGDYFKFLNNNKVGDKLTYLIRLEKPGYLQRTVIFSHTIDKPGEVNMNNSLNLSLGKVEVGMDLAKMIDIKPIYFDLGKSKIRPDAAAELDKIVQVMNEYPNMFIELGSHTDCRSSAAANLKLSTARAQASASYIVKKGINKMRITGKGYGETRLLNNCGCEGKVKSDCPEFEHEKNRRTEFLITRLK